MGVLRTPEADAAATTPLRLTAFLPKILDQLAQMAWRQVADSPIAGFSRLMGNSGDLDIPQ